jgi:hypothetical protein
VNFPPFFCELRPSFRFVSFRFSKFCFSAFRFISFQFGRLHFVSFCSLQVFLINNIFVIFCDETVQWVGIPMGTNSDPLLADMFLVRQNLFKCLLL